MLGAETSMSIGGCPGRVVVSGSGSPLLLLHGQGGHLENFTKNIAELATKHRVIAPDCVWHGLGPQPSFDAALLPAYIRQVRHIVDSADLGPVAILGQSMGAWTAMRMAIDYPNLVSALVLVNPQGVHLPQCGGDAEILPAPGPELAAKHLKALEDPTDQNIRIRLESLFFNSDLLDQETIDVRQRLYSMPSVNMSLRRVLAAYMGGPGAAIHRHRVSIDELHDIACPTLLLWGENNMTPPSVGIRIANELRRGEMLSVANAGHWMHYERSEWHNNQVLSFLKSI